MPENPNNMTDRDELREQNEQEDTVPERFESDTQKIVRRHLEDPDHVITDEEMQDIRVGMHPPEAGASTLERLKDEEALEDAEKKIVGNTDDIEEGKNKRDERITPWDTIDPD